MKIRWLALVLVLTLFCGCGGPETETVPSEALPETKPTESVGFYDPYSYLEQATDGAVKAYPLDIENTTGIAFLGDDILLFSGYPNTTLTLLAGENRYIKAEISLSCPVSPEDPGVTVSTGGVTYVDETSRELVFLNEMLAEIRRFPLPDGCGTAALSADGKLLYYCTADALRVLDLETELDRLIKEMHFPCQDLTALHCGDTVLQCSATYDDGNSYTLFFSAETGELLYETQGDVPLWTEGDLYFTIHMDGEYRELISGSLHFGPSILVAETEPWDTVPVLEQQSVLLYSKDGSSSVLDCYHLESGLHTARVTLPGGYEPFSVRSDPSETALWFLCCDPYTGQNILCAWDLDKASTEDSKNYLQPRWDWENPDLDGLARCRTLADRISDEHDVQILLWTEATEFQPNDYTLVPEYQVPLIEKRLYELDGILSCYPDGFLREAASRSSGRLNICLVRGIYGSADTGALESAAGIQYWDQNINIYLAVTLGDDMARHVHHELFQIIDSRVLSICSAYDNWNDLNPQNFQYDRDYTSNIRQNDWNLVAGDERYFIDFSAMTCPNEDRAKIMEYAMMEDQGNTFASAPMQAKLRQLCLGIRQAFHLELASQSFRWEQYLTEPLAPSQ